MWQLALGQLTNVAAGGRGGPAINYNFTTGVLPGGVTFSRSTKGWYFDSSGVLTEAAIDAPRFEYDPATLAGPYLLYEPQRTNLVTRATAIQDAAWTKQRLTATGNVITSPDGATTTTLLVEDTSTNSHRTYSAAYSATAAVTYTASIFAKPKERTLAAMNYDLLGSGAPFNAFYNLSTPSVTSAGADVSAGVQAINNGFARLFATSVSNVTNLKALGFYIVQTAGVLSYTGDGTSGLYAWGGQIEEGVEATSFIPTTTAAVTRGADTLSFSIPSGVSSLTYTFDDDSTQVVSVSPGAYSVPNTLDRWGIKSIVSDV